MNELRIESRDDLSSWLESHNGFPDHFVLRMEPRPQPDGAARVEDVTLVIATQVDGGFEAGERRHLRVFELRGESAETFWIENPRGYDSAFCNDEGIRQLDVDRPGIQLMVPSRVQLVCGSFVVTELEDRDEIIQPWIDEFELAALVSGSQLPSPGDLVELFAREGVAAVWHRFGEGPQTADSVPRDYSGWYLQQPGRFAKGIGTGLFVFSAAQRDQSFVLHMQNHDRSSTEIWNAWRKILLHYPDIEVRTGNCRLDSSQWRQYLKDGYVT